MNISIFKMALCIFSLTFLACGGKNDTVRDSARESLGTGTDAPVTNPGGVTPPGTFPTTTSVAGGVQHYICPKNCAGSGGSAAGTCPVCGSEYVHNQAFHSQTTTASTTPGTITTPGSTPTMTAPPPTSEPAQNAAGVWHYTCAKGCAGGGGAAGICATCGGALTHNAAYHQ